jgi:hypothetical protein
MSDYIQRPNSASLRKNPFKNENSNPKMPDTTGDGTITCPKCLEASKFEIAGWRRGGFLNLAFTDTATAAAKKEAARASKRNGGQPASSTPAEPTTPQDDDVPF